jgi:carbonic anhydrase/acetyltransferase-like protein (isoleucine patch superfamily)
VLVRPVRIGSYAFVGAGARLGPGSVIPHNASVPAYAVVDVNQTFGDEKRHHPDRIEADFALS